MLHAYQVVDGRLARLDPLAGLGQAIWIDLLCPDADEAARVEALGVEVLTLCEFEGE